MQIPQQLKHIDQNDLIRTQIKIFLSSLSLKQSLLEFSGKEQTLNDSPFPGCFGNL